MSHPSSLNRDLVLAWVAALESGEYQQGRGVLCQIGADVQQRHYCCLGVLCDVAGKRGDVASSAWEDVEVPDRGRVVGFTVDGVDYYTSELPPEMYSMVGLHGPLGRRDEGMDGYWRDVPVVTIDGRNDRMENFSSLAAANDNGATFTGIASVIRRDLLGESS